MPRLRIAAAAACAWLAAAACADTTAPGDPTAAHAASSAAVAIGARTSSAAAANAAGGPGAPAGLVSALGADLCAAVEHGTRASGTRIVTARCADAEPQRFAVAAPRQAGPITAYAGALCVTATSASQAAPIVLRPCDGSAAQRWARTAGGALVGVSGRCLTVANASTAAGAPLILWQCNGGAHQLWKSRTPDASPPTSWTFCTAAGAPCNFVGRRRVRLGGPDGPYVEQTAVGVVPCAVYGFGGVNPAPGRALHCDVSAPLTRTLANPMAGMAPLAAAEVVVPLGDTGADGPRRAGGAQPSASSSGSFRTTCRLSHFSFDDPIVYPGRANATHLHAFFGNTAVTAATTPASLVAGGNSTCRGGTVNRSAYWAPAVVDAATGAVQTPLDAVVYYKTGYNVAPAAVRTLPAGLRIVVGDMRSTGPQPYVEWGCRDRYVASTGAIPTVCLVGDAVRLTITFPQCWDGSRLDAPDHRSHMAYPKYRNPPAVSTCPPSHPVTLPAITEHFDYPVTAGAMPSRWRLSSDMYPSTRPGGYSAHADWMNGWDAAVMRTIVQRCLNRSMDCGVGLTGDGETLH